MSRASEYLRRSLLPRAVIATGEMDGPRSLASGLRRAFGGRACIELYFAFDDPYSALALSPLLELASRHNIRLELYPLIERGIAGDPAADQRQRHAVTDSGWLARRRGQRLLRSGPVDPQSTAFLAAWTESMRGSVVMAPFAAAALEQLWFRSSGPVKQGDFAALYHNCLQKEPPQTPDELLSRLAANAQRMKRKGHWESPAALVEGQWFFAHERISQIVSRLDSLGWLTTSAAL